MVADRLATTDADGYRPYALPAFGTFDRATMDDVNDVCDQWYVVEIEFVKRLVRRAADRWDPDSGQFAETATALSFFQAVRNGNGMARYVRDHLEGRVPIREPKGLFIRTIELHRSAALREARRERDLRYREVHNGFDDQDLLDAVAVRLGPRSSGYDDARVERCLQLRNDLIEIASGEGASPAVVEDRLMELERLCADLVEHRGMVVGLTARQRLVFLLRVDPLPAVDSMAVDYEHIASLSRLLGSPTTAAALRQSLRELLVRLRVDHASAGDDLRG